MSAAAVLSRQNIIGWPSPATPRYSYAARSDSKMKASPYVSSIWVVSIPPSQRKRNSPHPDSQKRVDFLTELPAELRIMILSYLSPLDLCRCQQVNSSWYHVITQDRYLMKKCQDYLKVQKIHYIKNQENYPTMFTPHVANGNSAGRTVLSLLQNSGRPLSYSMPPLPTMQSSPMTDLLNFDRLQLKDDITPGSHEQYSLKYDVRRCLFPDEDTNITHPPVLYTDSSIKDASFNICGRENKKRIKRL